MLFGKKKSNPKVKFTKFDLEFDLKSQNWKLQYKDIEFYFERTEIKKPTIQNLDDLISKVREHESRIEKLIYDMAKEWKEEGITINKSAAHIALISIENEKLFSASILGDDSWGDIGYDIWFENGKVLNEGFAD